MKFKRFWPLMILFFVGVVWARSSDTWSLRGRTYLKTTDVIRLTDSATPDIELYNGDIYLKGAETTPAQTAGQYPGIKVPFLNVSGTTMVQGNLVVASSVTTGGGNLVAVTATTTVVGICEGSVANNAVGYMTISGYALVLTTGTVRLGDVLVSSAPITSGARGYSGATAAPTSGTDIAVAMEARTTDGLVLALIGR